MNDILKVKLFFINHVNKAFLFISLALLINSYLYNVYYLNIDELFRGANQLGEILYTLSISFVASYIFYLINHEIPNFNGKVKSYLLFFKRKDNISFLVDQIIQQYSENEESWNKLTFVEKTHKIKETLITKYLLAKDLPSDYQWEQTNQFANEIVTLHQSNVIEIFEKIQNEFNGLNIHSKFLNTKLSILIAAVQEFDLFNLTQMFYSINKMVGKEEWDLGIFSNEYASTIDSLIKIRNTLSREIAPYWKLLRNKSINDII